MIDINQVQRDFDNGVIISRETIRQVIELAAVKNADARKLERAERALVSAGFQDLGGEEWKPPIGRPRTEYLAGGFLMVEDASVSTGSVEFRQNGKVVGTIVGLDHASKDNSCG